LSREDLIRSYGNEVNHRIYTTVEIQELLRKNSKYSIRKDKMATFVEDVKKGKEVDIQPIVNAEDILELSIICMVEELIIAVEWYKELHLKKENIQRSTNRIFSLIYIYGDIYSDNYYIKHLNFDGNPRTVQNNSSVIFDINSDKNCILVEVHPKVISSHKNHFSLVILTKQLIIDKLVRKI